MQAESTSADGRSDAPALDARYGRGPADRRRQRLLLTVVGAVFAVVLAAWVIWAGLDGTNGTIEANDTGHRVVDDRSVRVTFELSVEPGTTVFCAVQALNEQFAIVGWKVVEIPPSTHRTRSLTQTVLTTERGNTGLIYRCWLS